TPGSVAVAKNGSAYTIVFLGAFAGTNVPALTVTAPVSGSPLKAQDEVQVVSLINATGGSFTLTYARDVNGNHVIESSERATSVAINYGALATDVQTALENVVLIGTGHATVTRIGSTYTVTFTGTGVGGLSGLDVEPLTGDA